MAGIINRQIAAGLVPLFMLGAGAALLWGGPLNPPTGPISSGGKTTQEIYDAVTGISNSVGGSARGPAVPGGNTAAGTLAIPASGTFPAYTVPLVGLRLAMTGSNINGSGQIIGNPSFTGVTFVREMGPGDASQLRLAGSGFALGTVTATLGNPGGGVTTYTFTTSVVAGLRHYSVQRADGTFGSMEELDFSTTALRITEPGGATWNYNFVSHVGGP